MEQGDARGVPVVLLHAFLDSWRSFEGVLESLPGSIHALAPDQRGHGEAGKPPTGYAPADFAADLLLFMDDHDLNDAVLVASSSAGFTARRFAADNPARVRGIVFIGSPHSLAGKEGVEEMAAPIRALEDPVDPAFVRDFVTGTATDAVPADFLDAMVAESSKVPAHVWRLALEGLLDPCLPAGRLPGPALVIWGEQDAFLDRADQEALAETFEHAELRAYSAAGHIVHWEEPARVAADIAEFAQRVG